MDVLRILLWINYIHGTLLPSYATLGYEYCAFILTLTYSSRNYYIILISFGIALKILGSLFCFFTYRLGRFNSMEKGK